MGRLFFLKNYEKKICGRFTKIYLFSDENIGEIVLPIKILTDGNPEMGMVSQ